MLASVGGHSGASAHSVTPGRWQKNRGSYSEGDDESDYTSARCSNGNPSFTKAKRRKLSASRVRGPRWLRKKNVLVLVLECPKDPTIRYLGLG